MSELQALSETADHVTENLRKSGERVSRFR